MYLGYGLEEDYAGQDTKGKVLLIKAGSEDTKDARASFRLRSQKEELAQKHGALAIIEFFISFDLESLLPFGKEKESDHF